MVCASVSYRGANRCITYDVGFCVARSVEMGNAKALYRERVNDSFPRLFFYQPHQRGNMMLNLAMKKTISALVLSFSTLCIPVLRAQQPMLKGVGTKTDPIVIEDAGAFSSILYLMEKHEFFTKDKYYVLGNDIHLNSGVLDADGSLSADSLRFTSWEPIGRDSYGREFYGHFDGRGHTISGVYINESEGKNLGLFGVIAKEGEVCNLKLADSYICGNTYVGGITGLCKGKISGCESGASVVAQGATHEAGGIAGTVQGDGLVSKCVNSGYVRGITYADEAGMMYNCSTGGIAGSGARVDSCENRGTVISEGWGAAGGIAGSISGGKYISGCVNYGDVINNSKDNAGGIVGTNWAAVYNSRNYGSVVATEPGACIGGIAGKNSYNATVRGSENYASLHSEVDGIYVGGIVGNLDGGRQYNTYYTPKVYTSSNYGDISTTSTSSQCGGIAGRSYCGEMHKCYNSGSVTSRSMAGGILPKGEFHTHIYESVNEGHISGLRSTGGIVGNINGEVSDSRNSGLVSNIDRDSDCGGIVGWLSGSSGIIRYCVNTGEVSSGKHVGGLAGNNESLSSIISSYNAGYVHSETEGSNVGGVAGGYGSLRNCYNAGTVCAGAPGIRIGGVTNNLWVNWDGHGNRSGSTAKCCYNAGDIVVDASGCTVGNIAATYEVYNNSFLFDNCYYLKDAIYGDNYTYTDSVAGAYEAKNMKCIPREAFATLAESINKIEFPTDPKPFVQGRWRPLLVRDNYDAPSEPMAYFNVLTAAGDTVAVDLGLPLGNEFFISDSDGLPLEAYNVARNGVVRNAALVDDADFLLDNTLSVNKFHYRRHVSKGFNFSCLPVSVSQHNMPETAEISVPVSLKDDTLQIRRQPVVAAYEAFLFDGSRLPAFWNLTLSDITLECCRTVDENSDTRIVGSLTRLECMESGAYLLSDDCKSLRKSAVTDTVGAFRAYVLLPHTAPETIGFSYADDITSVEEINTPADKVYSDRMAIVVVTSSEKCPVEIYSLSGVLVRRVIAHIGRNEIEISRPGVYFVRLHGSPHKVILN